MSDYSDDGEIIPNPFAEVTYNPQDGITHCTYATCCIISSIASQTSDADEEVLPEDISCTHCRFFACGLLSKMGDILAGKVMYDSQLWKRAIDAFILF